MNEPHFLEKYLLLPIRNNRLVRYAFVLLLVLASALTGLLVFGKKDIQSSAAVLYRTDLEYTVEADGLAESRYKSEIHAPSGLKVMELYVEEGDRVQTGDVLALLDTDSLRLEIQRAELNIHSAEANMSSEQTALANSVTIARNSLASADVSLQAARREYESLLSRKGQETAVEVAGINLDAAQRAHEYNSSLFDIGGISREILVQSENTLDKAQTAYDDAIRNADESLDRAREAFEAAEIRYKTSNDTLADAVQKNTDPAAIALELQRVALQEKQLRMRDATILASSNGIVTFVNAKIGAPAAGLLFIIEDDQEILIQARVGEANIAQIPLGGICYVTPAGQDQSIQAIVTRIPFSAERDSTGSFSAVVGDDAYYIVEASLDETTSSIRIGMNVKVSFLIDTRTSCFVLPNNLIHKEGGRSWILAKDHSGRIQEIPVMLGLETRRFSEIISEGLYEGMEVVNATS